MDAQNVVYYVIDNKVKFCPSEASLEDSEGGSRQTLFRTASRCLEALIENQGNIVSQRTLMEIAWTDHGLNVNANTFYQNILSLRKSFNDLLPGKEVIVTVRRRGLVIPEKINITKAQAAEHSATAIVLPSAIVASEHPKDEGYQKQGHLSQPLLKHTSPIKYLLCALISIALLGTSSFYYFTRKPLVISSPFNGYILYKKNKECNVYINPDFGTFNPEESKLRNSIFNCKGYKNIYITGWEDTHRSSIFYCNTSTNKSYQCISEYYAQSQK